jgi:predicted MFS family arabinose efflux permease
MSLSAQSLPMPAQIPSEPLPRAAFGEMLRANMRADFTFYRRSRLLLAFAIVFLLISGLFMLPTFFSDSRVEHFNT